MCGGRTKAGKAVRVGRRRRVGEFFGACFLSVSRNGNFLPCCEFGGGFVGGVDMFVVGSFC